MKLGGLNMWNYRVLKEEIPYKDKKSESFRIIEVYYDDNGSINGWVDCTDTILHVVSNPYDDEPHAYEDLKGGAEHVLDAFKLPCVMKNKDGQLVEVEDKP
jgi:hypothetical protein